MLAKNMSLMDDFGGLQSLGEPSFFGRMPKGPQYEATIWTTVNRGTGQLEYRVFVMKSGGPDPFEHDRDIWKEVRLGNSYWWSDYRPQENIEGLIKTEIDKLKGQGIEVKYDQSYIDLLQQGKQAEEDQKHIPKKERILMRIRDLLRINLIKQH